MVPILITAAATLVVTLMSVIVGSILTSRFTWQREQLAEQRRTDTMRKRLAAALLVESTVLRDRYVEVFANPMMMWKPNQPLELGGYTRVTNLFAVYDQNTDELGLFEAEDITKIVRAYTLAKGQVESISAAAEMMMKLDHQELIFRSVNNLVAASALSVSVTGITNKLAGALRKESDGSLRATDEAITALKKYV
jgi:hypothetical protein